MAIGLSIIFAIWDGIKKYLAYLAEQKEKKEAEEFEEDPGDIV